MTDTSDRLSLMANDAFRRFLLALVVRSGLFDTSASGSDGRNLVLEGRKGLALEVLREFEDARQVKSPIGIPVFTLIQTLREAVHSAVKETPDGPSHDPYSDLDDRLA